MLVSVVDANGNVTGNSTSILTGQQAVAVTGTAIALAGSPTPLRNGLFFTASSKNSGTMTIGASSVNNTTGGTGNGYELLPGQSASIGVTDASLVYINGTAGNYGTWMGN